MSVKVYGRFLSTNESSLIPFCLQTFTKEYMKFCCTIQQRTRRARWLGEGMFQVCTFRLLSDESGSDSVLLDRWCDAS
jgi:hypothetical protein